MRRNYIARPTQYITARHVPPGNLHMFTILLAMRLVLQFVRFRVVLVFPRNVREAVREELVKLRVRRAPPSGPLARPDEHVQQDPPRHAPPRQHQDLEEELHTPRGRDQNEQKTKKEARINMYSCKPRQAGCQRANILRVYGVGAGGGRCYTSRPNVAGATNILPITPEAFAGRLASIGTAKEPESCPLAGNLARELPGAANVLRAMVSGLTRRATSRILEDNMSLSGPITPPKWNPALLSL